MTPKTMTRKDMTLRVMVPQGHGSARAWFRKGTDRKGMVLKVIVPEGHDSVRA